MEGNIRKSVSRYVAGLANSGNNFMTDAVGKEVKEEYVNSIVQIITQSNRALIERIRSELPKQVAGDLSSDYQLGRHDALDDVIAVLTVIEGEMK